MMQPVRVFAPDASGNLVLKEEIDGETLSKQHWDNLYLDLHGKVVPPEMRKERIQYELKINKRSCVVCDKKFDDFSRALRYCSDTCAYEADKARRTARTDKLKKPKACRMCGKGFMTKNSGNEKYCGNPCTSDYIKRQKIRSRRERET